MAKFPDTNYSFLS